jgi:hypothetical protein
LAQCEVRNLTKQPTPVGVSIFHDLTLLKPPRTPLVRVRKGEVVA